MAPEVFANMNDNENNEKKVYDGMKADIWSLGLILFRMLGETFPYEGPFKESLSLSQSSISFQPFCGIYWGCTKLDPTNRPSINEIFETM